MVNPHFLDASLETMDLCFGKWGFVQLGEMLTYLMDYRMNTDPVEKLVRQAQQFDVPVQVHISTSNAKGQGGYVSGEAQLEDMLDLTERVPDVRYIIAHGIGAPAKEPPVIEAYLRVIDRRYGRWPEHLWMEIKDFNATDAISTALPHIPSTRLLAGTDWENPKEPPFPPYGTMFWGGRDGKPFTPNVKSLVRLLKEAGADDATIRRIAWQNAAGLYKLKKISK
jgi:predicted TIM-barrel fold metal-dependent hydrolase